MKALKYSKILAAALLAGAPLLWSSCSDSWNEHYDVQQGGMADQPSLLANIQADSQLANFYKVIKAVGGEELLNSPQQLTVWAPLSLTSEQADSIIAVYQRDLEAGLKYEDNKALTQFLNNHMALYARPVSSLTNDTVKMLSNKYMHLVGTSSTTGTLSNNPFVDAVICNNGILYKTQNVQTFFPNIREFLEQNTSMDSIVSLVKTYDEYELDENASVAGGIVDGKTVYLDSVTNLTNELLQRYGYIQREDSVYTLIAPTNEVWQKLYDKYSQYYQYVKTVNNADSLADINVKRRIIEGRFFNTSADWKYNRNPKDSLCNTQYRDLQVHNPRQNVYYNPEETILNGLQKIECSNGFVYIDDKGVIDPRTTFFGRMDFAANSPAYYEIPRNTSNDEIMNVSHQVYEKPVAGDSTSFKNYYYAQVTAKTSSAQTSLEYKLPGTLSNVYYNIYVVTVPPRATNPSEYMPLWFQVSQATLNDKGNFTSWSYFNNPNPVTEGSVDNSDVILKQSNNQRCFVTDINKVDTILIQSAVKYDFAGEGLDEGVVKLNIGSWGPSSATYREKIYTRTLRLNEIIMVPFETKEEAEEAAYDLNAINDEILEANKKK